MRSSPQKCAFEEVIIILVVRLSRFFIGHWFSIVGCWRNTKGASLTCNHIRLAIKSRNDARLVEPIWEKINQVLLLLREHQPHNAERDYLC